MVEIHRKAPIKLEKRRRRRLLAGLRRESCSPVPVASLAERATKSTKRQARIPGQLARLTSEIKTLMARQRKQNYGQGFLDIYKKREA